MNPSATKIQHLFFRGPVRIGKSTHLRHCINAYTNQIIGMSGQRILDKNQSILGYQSLLIENTTLPQVNIQNTTQLPDVFIYKGKKNATILQAHLKYIKEQISQKKYQLIVLDEIGGFELKNETVLGYLKDILQQAIPCVGILKEYNPCPKPNNPSFQLDYWAEYQQLCKWIESNGKVIDVTASTLDYIDDNMSLLLNQL